jgi:hypothetical protein
MTLTRRQQRTIGRGLAAALDRDRESRESPLPVQRGGAGGGETPEDGEAQQPHAPYQRRLGTTAERLNLHVPRPADPDQDTLSPDELIRRLRAEIRQKDQLIAELRDRLEADANQRADEVAQPDLPAGRFVDGQRVLTVHEAHRAVNRMVSIPTIYRYCATGWWQTITTSTGQVLITADQELTIKRK